jgi:hypothetical protein
VVAIPRRSVLATEETLWNECTQHSDLSDSLSAFPGKVVLVFIVAYSPRGENARLVSMIRLYHEQQMHIIRMPKFLFLFYF